MRATGERDTGLRIVPWVASPLSLVIVLFFAASSAGRAALQPRGVLFAQATLLSLLGAALIGGVAAVVRREPPRWIAAGGLTLTLTVIALLAAFFLSLDD